MVIEARLSRRSNVLRERALARSPGGVHSNVRLAGPTVFIERAEGASLFDVNGADYVDYLLGQGPNSLGQAPRHVVETTGAIQAGKSSFDAGRSASVRLDTGQTVIRTTKVAQPLTTAQVIALGPEPAQSKAIVAKGVHSPLAGYGPSVSEAIPVDTPGITAANFCRFCYQRRRRPLFPFETDPEYPAVHAEMG